MQVNNAYDIRMCTEMIKRVDVRGMRECLKIISLFLFFVFMCISFDEYSTQSIEFNCSKKETIIEILQRKIICP